MACTHTHLRYRYPSVFVVYQTIPSIILAVLVLVGFSARRKLFCRSQDLQESIRHPTPFCTLTGKGCDDHKTIYTIHVSTCMQFFTSNYCRHSFLLCCDAAPSLVAVAHYSRVLGCCLAIPCQKV